MRSNSHTYPSYSAPALRTCFNHIANQTAYGTANDATPKVGPQRPSLMRTYRVGQFATDISFFGMLAFVLLKFPNYD
ncbi:unnamed protein product [Sphagnum balticum]